MPTLSHDSAHVSILRQRETILQYTLWATVILASIAYVPSVWLGYRLDIPLLIIADTVTWVMAIALAFWRTPTFRTRAMIFIGVWAAFGMLILWLLGPIGAGTDWLLVVPILSALFFGYTGAYFGIAFIIVVTIAYALLLALSGAPNPIDEVLVYELASWGGVAGTLMFLAAMVSMAIARLLDGLEQSLIALDDSRQQMASALSEREQLQEQLLHSQKLSALGTMASGIAHDFNNLLVPILMASEAAQDDAPPGSAQHKHLGHVIISAERARDLIKRLLSFSQNLPQASTPVVVANILKETAVILRSSMPANITIECDIDEPAARIIASPDALQQISMNLGTNACLAMKPQGGTLILRQRCDHSTHTIRIDVIDTGRGIPDHLHSRIFEPFFTTRAPGEGTGLGLSIVHRLVSDTGGTLTFHSSSAGTTFSIEFSLASVLPSPETNIEDSVGAAPQSHQLSILVVDDEELIRGTLRMILESAHYKVQEAASAQEALELLGLLGVSGQSGTGRGKRRHYDLLITDETMPGMHGSDLAAKLAIDMPTLPVMIISGQLDPRVREKLQLNNVIAVLDKPFNRKSLLASLAAVHPKN
ncbi:MAG: response regulator [Pseudohongiella sp.]|nr:response regulator [Pseudohongiella sp.]